MPDIDNAALMTELKEGNARAEKLQGTTNEILREVASAVSNLSSTMKHNGRVDVGGSGTVTLANVLLIIGAVSAIGMVMIQATDKSIASLNRAMDSYIDRERIDAAEDAKVVESLKEVETQFDGVRNENKIEFGYLKNTTAKSEAWQDEHDLRVRGLNAAQWERIKGLERVVFGQAGKISGGEGYGAEQ